MSKIGVCSESLDNYISCLKLCKNGTSQSTLCKTTLNIYNDCVLGKGEWAAKHKEFERIENEKASRNKFAIDMPPYVN